MKKVIFVFAFMLAMIASGTVYAAKPVKVEDSLKQLAAEYEKVEGMDCMVIQKGEGLGLIKAMFNQQFGRKFMKGVTSMIIIDYTNASEETALALRQRIEAYKEVLDEFDISDEELNEGEYLKSYAKINSKTSISDFMILMEDNESKMLLYMGGELNIEKLDFNF